MAKRSGSELNHLNWDQVDDEKEDPGKFVPLQSAQLQNRVIKRAKRTLSPGDDKESGAVNAGPFSAFSGFSKVSSKPMFGFQSQDSKTSSPISIAAAPDNGSQNGREANTKPVSEPPSKEAKPVDQGKLKETDIENVEYFHQLQRLNKSIIEWMQLHISKNPCCDFTPVFEDYKTHLRKLDRLYTVPKTTKASSFDTSRSSMFKMPQPASSDTSLSSKSSHSGFQMLGKKSSDPNSTKTCESDSAYGAHFASNTTNTSTFSFGIKQSPTAMTTGSKSGPTTSHSSGKDAAEEEDSEGKEGPKFSFGLQGSTSSSVQNSSAKPFTFASTAVTNTAESGQNSKENVDEYIPPKHEFTAVNEEDAIYSKRCKLFFKKENEFVDKGVGTLYLKLLDGKTQLLVRADTSLGNILLNIMLSESLPIERTGKNNVLLVCVPYPPINPKEKDSKKAIPLLIRVKTSEDADELFEKLKECKS